MGKWACYGVRNVPRAGVYTSWPEAEAAFRGVSGEQHKGFRTHDEAAAWVASSASAATGRTPLFCPFHEKDEAKALGARWDGTAWYVPAGVSAAPFARWLEPPASAKRRRRDDEPTAAAAPSSAAAAPSSAAAAAAPSSAAAAAAAAVPSAAAAAPRGKRPRVAAAAEARADELALYTDGSCRGNAHVHSRACPAGWGVAVVAEGGGACVAELCGPVELDRGAAGFLGAEVGSNNTGELSAICEALRWLIGQQADTPAVICYDSEYAANQIQGLWKTNTNRALVARGQALLREARGKRSIRFLHVKGHSGHRWNELADQLANRGASGERS